MNRADYIEKDLDQSPFKNETVCFIRAFTKPGQARRLASGPNTGKNSAQLGARRHLAYIPGGDKQKIIRMRLKG